MQYEIRPATGADAGGIAAAHVASWQSAYRGLLPDDLLDNLSVAGRERSWLTTLTRGTPRTETWVAEDARGVAGFASIGPRRHENPREGDGELYAIYLHPAHWGRGIGHDLHATAIRRLRELGYSTASLWVLDGNRRAIDFYRRTGWCETGVTRIDVRADGTELPEKEFGHALPAADP